MEYRIHLAKSLWNVRKRYPLLRGSLTKQVLGELHIWLDHFYGKRGEGYDYSDFSVNHREQRHHRDGIDEVVKILSQKYGERYSCLVREEAERHIVDDMGRIVKSKQEYLSLRMGDGWV